MQAGVLDDDTLTQLSSCALLEHLVITLYGTLPPEGAPVEQDLLSGLPSLAGACKRLKCLNLSAYWSADEVDIKAWSVGELMEQLGRLPCLEEVRCQVMYGPRGTCSAMNCMDGRRVGLQGGGVSGNG